MRFRNQGDPILNVSSPKGVDPQLQKETLDLVGSLNKKHLDVVGDPEIATRIASYEMAARLQSSAPADQSASGNGEDSRHYRRSRGMRHRRTEPGHRSYLHAGRYAASHRHRRRDRHCHRNRRR